MNQKRKKVKSPNQKTKEIQMDTFFPALILSTILEFRQCFTRPNYKYFQAYVWAMMINNSSKCATNMAEACFFLGKHLSSFARFLADNKWDSSKIKKKMVEILLSHFPEQFLINGAFLGVIDTTLVAKASKKMFGVQKWHPSSGTAEKMNGVFGHHWGDHRSGAKTSYSLHLLSHHSATCSWQEEQPSMDCRHRWINKSCQFLGHRDFTGARIEKLSS